MERLGIVKIGLRLCLLIALMTNKSDAGIIGRKQYPNFTYHNLYNVSDDVVILNATNFKASIYDSTKGWLVEFYNSWCGFCQRYASIWKALATDLHAWNDIVAIAAIDCAEDENNPICREYEIMHYPMLKYFSVNAHPPSLGIIIEKGESIDEVRHNLASRLEMEQQEGRGSIWPNIAPYRNTEITDIWKTATSNVKHFFLIFENTDSYLGMEVILDLHKISGLQIRRVTSDNELLCVMNKVIKFPTLIAFNRNETQRTINIRIPTRQGVRQAITAYMVAKGTIIDEASTTLVLREMQQRVKSHEEQTTLRKMLGDHLYQLDLESALRYSLGHEIPLAKIIDGERMRALQKYLSVLMMYFPLQREFKTYLKTIHDVISKKSHVTGEEFSQLIKATEERMSVYSLDPRRWIGCKGSTDSYRGYPCGLWTLFHVLTVSFALEKNSDDSRVKMQNQPTLMLTAIYDYITNFFGCDDCVRHFVRMVDEKIDARSRDDSVLWLWRMHNQVNARLSGDQTEDPEYKKIQYPSMKHCAPCRFVNGTWNEKEVLRYLKHKYSYMYEEIDNGDHTNGVVNGNESKARTMPELLNIETKRVVSSENLNGFDFSIWLALYVTSSIIFTLVCSKELRNYKRRVVYLQDEVYKKRKMQLNNILTKMELHPLHYDVSSRILLQHATHERVLA